MSGIKAFFGSLRRVFYLFGKPKRYLAFVLLTFFIVALLDMVGISLIGPYVVVFFDVNKLQSNYPFLSSYNQEQLIAASSLILISIFVIRAISLWIIQNFILKISFERQVELRRLIISCLINQDYSKRVSKTTAQYQTALFAYSQNFVQSLINSFRIMVELSSVILILILLMFTNFTFFIISFLFASLGLIIMTRIFSKDFVRWGESKNKGLNELVTSMNEALDGIKEVKILGVGNIFEAKVNEAGTRVAAAERRLYLNSIIPRYLLELLLVMIICILLSISFLNQNETLETLSTLSIFLVAAMRLLPSMNLIISCINGISLNVDAVKNLSNELEDMNMFDNSVEVIDDAEDLDDFQQIHLKNVSFSYDNKDSLLKNINLSISKGDFIGISGSSGSGKTTLVDLMMGLNKPNTGDILLDNESIYNLLSSWRKRLAYLPQEIFLIEGSILENICIGHDINQEQEIRALEICRKVGLDNVIHSLPQGIQTQIGERGLKFSGGQRQRIALARAFFNNREIIFLDESTSALDHESSIRVINNIAELCKSGLTAILITHNQKLLSECTRVVSVKEGEVIELG